MLFCVLLKQNSAIFCFRKVTNFTKNICCFIPIYVYYTCCFFRTDKCILACLFFFVFLMLYFLFFHIFNLIKKCSAKVIQKCSSHIGTPKRTIKKYKEVRNRPIILTLHEITIERGLGKSSRDPSLSSCYYISYVYYFLWAVAVLLLFLFVLCVVVSGLLYLYLFYLLVSVW